jgi:uncharacterized protein (DUF2267 family)
MKLSWKRCVRATAAFLVMAAGIAAAVRAYRRESWRLSRAPAPVDDATLADRVRSELGALERSLDVPHVHVMVERHIALLHGEVPSVAAGDAIVRRVLAVDGVRGVQSHLHVGLLASDTRPSEAATEASSAARQLVDAALRAGGGEATAPLATRAVLGTFAEMLPARAVARIRSHLPADAAALLAPPTRAGVVPPISSLTDLYASVRAIDAFPPTRVPWVVDGVLTALRRIVPDDARAVAEDLPDDVRRVWLPADTAAASTS